MDETVYELLIPIDKPEVMTQALKVMSEFATKVRISDADVNDERGAVLEEMRMGRDARGGASRDRINPHLPLRLHVREAQ
jgi:predicted Zn-dependent peptidase